eukprot:Cvel_20630.t1-p1 / transcript=Cvel_20630.t1 / gene=Cvel_20630 / organism=Chromera_velia_CCMP2878 / gene_product=F-box/WD repeat-containing protein sel-10, putative / transcript_product=F-box/WD repeat-containing protein sel-10, putative / location=Cvel_scaffold1869:32373-37721(+) / protein_length=453 / sequence_SO=supercontig / SO=protein_coding / is_pseudo=false
MIGPISLFVQYPNRPPVHRDVVPSSLSAVREQLEIFDDQDILINHKVHKSEFFLLEASSQLWDGASLKIQVPTRKALVTCGRDILDKEVVWFPGASPEQIEAALKRACRLDPQEEVEILDERGRGIVLSATLPNDIKLTVRSAATQRDTHTDAPSGAAQERETGGGGRVSLRGVRDRGERETAQTTGGAPSAPDYPAKGGQTEGPTRQPYAHTHAQNRPLSASDRDAERRGGGGGGPRSHPVFDEQFDPADPGMLGVMQPGFKVAARASSPVPASAAGRNGGPLPLSKKTQSLIQMQSGGMHSSLSASAASGGGGRSSQGEEGKVRARVQQDCVHVLSGHVGFVSCMEVVGDVLFTGSQDANIMIWDLNNLCLCSSYPRKILCSGSQDKTIKVWSLETFSAKRTLVGHQKEVMSLLLLERKECLLSGSEDKTLRLWCLNNLNPLLILDEAHSA